MFVCQNSWEIPGTQRAFTHLVEEECVLVVGLDELVLADAAAQAEDVGHVVLLPLRLQVLRYDLVRLLTVPLLVTPATKKNGAKVARLPCLNLPPYYAL